MRDRRLLLATGVWCLALVTRVVMLEPGRRGFVAIVDDRAGSLVLLGLAALGGALLGSWRWPALVAASWVVLAGGFELVHVVVEHHRVLRTRWFSYLPRHHWIEIDWYDPFLLVLFAACGFAIAAAAGTLVRRPLGGGSGLARWWALLLAAMVGAGWLTEAEAVSAWWVIAAALPLGAAALFRPRRAAPVLALAFLIGMLGYDHWRMLDGGLAPFWSGSMGRLLGSGLDSVLGLALLVVVAVVLPAVLVGAIIGFLSDRLDRGSSPVPGNPPTASTHEPLPRP